MPSYAAGRTRGHAYFLRDARLVAAAGHPVLLPGWNSHQQGVASVRAALDGLGIPACRMPGLAREALGTGASPMSCSKASTGGCSTSCAWATRWACAPSSTRCCVCSIRQGRISPWGVFHPPYRRLQSDAGALLDQPAQCVIKGGRGEFERHPSSPVTTHFLRSGATGESVAAPLMAETRRRAGPRHPRPDAPRPRGPSGTGSEETFMKTFPMFLRMEDRTVVILGGGDRAAQECHLTLRTEARIVVAARALDDELAALHRAGRIAWHEGSIAPAFLEDTALAFIATGCPGADAALHAPATEVGALVKVVDAPDLRDAINPLHRHRRHRPCARPPDQDPDGADAGAASRRSRRPLGQVAQRVPRAGRLLPRR